MSTDAHKPSALFDGERFREAGHRLVELLADHLAQAYSTGRVPVLPRGTPTDVALRFDTDFATPAARDVVDVVRKVLDDAIAVQDPHFIGHQVAPPLPEAALVELASSLLANGMAVFEMGKAGVAMERAVLRFFSRAVGYDDRAGGVLTHGGSLGNLTALLAARQASRLDVWHRGVKDAPPLAVVVAESAHYSVARAARILGIGTTGILTVPCDPASRMRVDALGDVLDDAKRRGQRVLAVVAQAGSTGTGAFDPLAAVADVCAARGVWMHVDGAHGASLVLSRTRGALTEGIARADSVVWDAHKMLMMPALSTAVLFKDAAHGARAFAQEASYLFHDDDDEAWADVGKRTIECTKRMLALPLYAALSVHGAGLLSDHVDGVCDRAASLARLVRAREELELLTEPVCNIVCFRVRGLTPGQQAAVRRRLVEDGRFYIVHMRVQGELWLRAVVLHPRTTDEDLGVLLDEVLRIGADISGRPSP